MVLDKEMEDGIDFQIVAPKTTMRNEKEPNVNARNVQIGGRR